MNEDLEPSPTRGTKQELSHAFEWLRGIAISTPAALTEPQAARLAAVVMQELVDLTAKFARSVENTDEALLQISRMANVLVEWCDKEAAGDHASKEIWTARAEHIRKGMPQTLAFTAVGGHA